MAGTNEPDQQQEEGVQHDDCNFQWDENSQLYYHSRVTKLRFMNMEVLLPVILFKLIQVYVNLVRKRLIALHLREMLLSLTKKPFLMDPVQLTQSAETVKYLRFFPHHLNGGYKDEEIWRSQYGQVIKSDEELATAFPVVDLWDWKKVDGTRKEGKSQVSRLVGRLVRRSVKLHPSMPSSVGVLKTAPICEVHLDLVRVTSGQVYKLRSPSVGYLASLTSYDSSNPTKDWGYPKLSIEGRLEDLPRSCKNPEPKIREGTAIHGVMSSKQLHVSPKNTGHAYRDRAAERRALHGSYGVAPGEKKDKADLDSAPSSPVNVYPEEAAAESLNMSFGAGSFAKRIMESMGWKEGEALGSSVKGLTEPLRAVGNTGNAGLGWDHTRKLP